MTDNPATAFTCAFTFGLIKISVIQVPTSPRLQKRQIIGSDFQIHLRVYVHHAADGHTFAVASQYAQGCCYAGVTGQRANRMMAAS